MARRKKNEEEPKNQENINNDADDTFGLPEVEYEPLKRDEPVAENEPEVVHEPEPEPEPEVPAEPEYISEPVVEHREEVYEHVEEHVDERVDEPVEHIEVTEHHYVPPHHDDDYHHHYEPESPMWPKVLAVILFLLLAGGAVYYFAVYQPAKKAEAELIAERERSAAEAARKRKLAEDAEKARLAAEQRRLDSLANVPKQGSLELLSQRTGQYYVVVASAIDDDLLTDFANKLVKEGKAVKIIPPFGKNKQFYRLAIDSRDTYADAQAAADGMKGGDFGNELWVVRY